MEHFCWLISFGCKHLCIYYGLNVARIHECRGYIYRYRNLRLLEIVWWMFTRRVVNEGNQWFSIINHGKFDPWVRFIFWKFVQVEIVWNFWVRLLRIFTIVYCNRKIFNCKVIEIRSYLENSLKILHNLKNLDEVWRVLEILTNFVEIFSRILRNL